MELLFNELSVTPLSTDAYKANDKMVQFSKTVAAARRKGFRNIRSHYAANQIHLAENYTLYDWLVNKDVPKDYKDTLYGMIIQPFINEDDTVIETQYLESEYYFEDIKNDIPETECLGLASAYLYETLCISLSSKSVWDQTILSIVIKKESSQEPTENALTANVFNVSSNTSFEVQEIATFVENLGVIELIETRILPDNKKIHLADHHGKAELQSFCNRLKNSPYVTEMRSTNWGGKDFIRKTHKDGSIEIVLVDTQRQYALWVQTTGRNLRETKAIAQILEDRFF